MGNLRTRIMRATVGDGREGGGVRLAAPLLLAGWFTIAWATASLADTTTTTFPTEGALETTSTTGPPDPPPVAIPMTVVHPYRAPFDELSPSTTSVVDPGPVEDARDSDEPDVEDPAGIQVEDTVIDDPTTPTTNAVTAEDHGTSTTGPALTGSGPANGVAAIAARATASAPPPPLASTQTTADDGRSFFWPMVLGGACVLLLGGPIAVRRLRRPPLDVLR